MCPLPPLYFITQVSPEIFASAYELWKQEVVAAQNPQQAELFALASKVRVCD